MAQLNPRQLETLANLRNIRGITTPEEAILFCQEKVKQPCRTTVRRLKQEYGKSYKRQFRKHSRKH